MGEWLTVPKHYLDTLIRRAALHAESNSGPDDRVLVPKTEYSNLVRYSHQRKPVQKLMTGKQRIEREYAILRQTLLGGGLSLDTLHKLLQGDPEQADACASSDDWELPSAADEASAATGPHRQCKAGARPTTETQSHNVRGALPSKDGKLLDAPPPFRRSLSGVMSSVVGVDDDSSVSKAKGVGDTQRTILISNLSDKATQLDIVQLIRGGRLLQIDLHSDRTAAVSFAEGAADFLAYTKRRDLYLHSKRLEFRWRERQYYVNDHIANQLARGATRNIIVRTKPSRQGPNPPGLLTESGIREDLEHIDNLEILSVTFREDDCYISTNSVPNGLYAKTCMMSRAKYKGMRIEWYPDECAQPIPQIEKQRPEPRQEGAPRTTVMKQAAIISCTNRFEVLDIDGVDDSPLESEFGVSCGDRIWTTGGVAV